MTPAARAALLAAGPTAAFVLARHWPGEPSAPCPEPSPPAELRALERAWATRERAARERAEPFEAALYDSLEACRVPATVAEVDCEDPPCIAILDEAPAGVAGAVGACGPWAARYAAPPDRLDVGVDCSGGRTRGVVALVEPASPTEVAPWWMEPVLLAARVRARAAWACEEE